MNEKKQLIEYIVQDIVEMITQDQGVEFDEAMDRFYESEVFDKLQDVETGLYRESTAYIYDLYKDELNFGRILQAEI
jgi:predicted transcriptional regulator